MTTPFDQEFDRAYFCANCYEDRAKLQKYTFLTYGEDGVCQVCEVCDGKELIRLAKLRSDNGE